MDVVHGLSPRSEGNSRFVPTQSVHNLNLNKNTGFIPFVDCRRQKGGEAREQPEVAMQNVTPEGHENQHVLVQKPWQRTSPGRQAAQKRLPLPGVRAAWPDRAPTNRAS